jgi:hypothetical protein
MTRGELLGNDRIVSDDNKIWRDPNHDAANVLYLFLRIYGFAASYNQICDATPSQRHPQSLQEIKTIAESLGCPMAIRQIKPDEDLKMIPLPVITFLEGDTLEKGSFVLLLQVRKNEILFVDGASALVSVVSRESFFRRWNGIVTIPIARRAINLVYVSGIGFFLGAIMLRRWIHTACGFSLASVFGLSFVLISNSGLAQEPTPPNGQAITLPEDCANALKKQASLLQTCKVEYDATHEYGVELANSGEPTSEKVSSVLSKGRYHRHREAVYPGQQQARVFEVAFDGKIFYTGHNAGPQSSSVTKYLGDNVFDNKAETMVVNDFYFESAGFIFPLAISDWRSGGVLSSFALRAATEGTISSITENNSDLLLQIEFPDPVLLIAHRIDLDRIASPPTGQLVPAAGSNALPDFNAQANLYRRLRARKPFRKTTILLDAQKGYALQSREDRTADGELIFTIQCADFKSVHDDGLWLPQTITKTNFATAPELLAGFGSTPKEIVTYKLQQFTFDVPTDATFSIEGGPGSSVSDRSVPASKQDQNGAFFYQVPHPNDALRQAAEAERSKRPPSRSPSRWNFLIVANVAVLAVIGIMLFFRSRAKRR